jgi:phosphatidylglycerol lysyltransferase
VGEHSDDLAVERALHYIYEHVNRFYNFKGLHAFKDKFHPRWEPRYLIYPGPAALPAVAAALVRIDAGEDFPWAYLRH